METIIKKYLKSLFAKTDKSIFVKLRYLRLKIKKNIENNKNFCVTFDHNFKNIPLYVMSNISFERYYFVLYDSYLISKMSKIDLSVFANKLFICSFHSRYLSIWIPTLSAASTLSRVQQFNSTEPSVKIILWCGCITVKLVF